MNEQAFSSRQSWPMDVLTGQTNPRKPVLGNALRRIKIAEKWAINRATETKPSIFAAIV
ncbi:MAG: hypothetical protein ACK51D_17370 [Cyclobacteriaceae bacterium]